MPMRKRFTFVPRKPVPYRPSHLPALLFPIPKRQRLQFFGIVVVVVVVVVVIVVVFVVVFTPIPIMIVPALSRSEIHLQSSCVHRLRHLAADDDAPVPQSMSHFEVVPVAPFWMYVAIPQ